MATINTETSYYFDRIPDLVRALRMKIAEEYDAINCYENFIRGIRMMGVPSVDGAGNQREIMSDQLSVDDAEDLCELIDKIHTEEIDHAAVLTSLLRDLDPKFNGAMGKGLTAL